MWSQGVRDEMGDCIRMDEKFEKRTGFFVNFSGNSLHLFAVAWEVLLKVSQFHSEITLRELYTKNLV